MPPAPAVPAFDLGWHLAMNAVVEKRAEWLTSKPADSRQVEPVPCCDPLESMPCQACVMSEGPADLSDEGWGDEWRWSTSDFAPEPDDEAPPPIRLDFPGWIAYQAAEHAKIGGERHAWLAGKIAGLAEQARFLDAASPDAFDDRLDAHLDAHLDAAAAGR